MNPVEPNNIKKEIEDRANKLGKSVDILYDKNYYDGQLKVK
ncbi:hypothetical protein CLPU_7c00240 [Gottschalkia purinilytica]|uniref:Uncharacterized protein n=1 Tax=Gottschalkia purinilytica TaxID=1503 RepID=A0A0L0WA90_GOTPU|nr:hypothetical protein CLPU_7c00240 [Gottschalkia purinilytica]